MNWTFPKAIGLILFALSGILVPTSNQNQTAKPPVVVAQATPKQAAKDHDHEPPVEKPAPAEQAPAKPAPKPVPPKPAPDKEVDSEPEDLKPLAKAVISTIHGERVPKFWPCGVPLELTSIGSIAGDHPQSIRWDIQPKWVDQYSRRAPGGRQVSLATGIKSKTIRVTLYVAKDDTFDMTSVIIHVRPDPNEPGDGDRPQPGPKPPEPAPGPEPAPEPVPEPVEPVLSATAKKVHDLAIRDIPDIPSRKDKVKALAVSHERIADEITQGVAGVPAYAHLKTPQGIIDATTKSNRAAVGDDRPAFVEFFKALNVEVLKPMAGTTLSTAGGHIEVWKDIAAGLRASAP
jgi:hypothetical protein